MGSRSRKRRRDPSQPRLSSEERNEQVRARLKPLAPGERPRPVTVAAVVATLAVPANFLATVLASHPSDAQWRFTVLQCLVLAAAAYGLWKSRYWAVLGFQVLLALTCVIAAGQILLAGNVLGALVGLAMLALAGTLFWFLVRSMARIQMPDRPGSVRRHG